MKKVAMFLLLLAAIFYSNQLSSSDNKNYLKLSHPKSVSVKYEQFVQHIKICSYYYGVNEHFAEAVAIVESRPRGGGMKFVVGPLGKGTFVGPFGIHNGYDRANIYDPYENIRIGVISLMKKKGRKTERQVLKNYNRSFTEGYYNEIKRIQRVLEYRGIATKAASSAG